MATKEALEGLKKTGAALAEIKMQLKPFLDRLETAEGKALAQAQAAVALSVGTLRYMGARLRGLDQGRKADDPLRQELNEMKRVLKAVEQMKDDDAGSAKKGKKNDAKRKRTPEKRTPRKRKAGDEVEEKQSTTNKSHEKVETKERPSKEKQQASLSPKKKRQRKR